MGMLSAQERDTVSGRPLISGAALDPWGNVGSICSLHC